MPLTPPHTHCSHTPYLYPFHKSMLAQVADLANSRHLNAVLHTLVVLRALYSMDSCRISRLSVSDTSSSSCNSRRSSSEARS